ncbi:MAG: TetR family transcriptional regulator C-terminal domain-containing protein [Actinomycetota bacterium]
MDPAERRQEIVVAASRIAVGAGLERVTAKRVADVLEVVPGLINHYFGSVDDLVAAAFGHAAEIERAALFGGASAGKGPQDELKRLLDGFLHSDRDPVNLLWLDAWQASRRRPALLREVVRQMDADTSRLADLITRGVEAGQFGDIDAASTALRIMALVDGLSIRAATRAQIDYSAVAELVVSTIERELGLAPGELRG